MGDRERERDQMGQGCLRNKFDGKMQKGAETKRRQGDLEDMVKEEEEEDHLYMLPVFIFNRSWRRLGPFLPVFFYFTLKKRTFEAEVALFFARCCSINDVSHKRATS